MIAQNFSDPNFATPISAAQAVAYAKQGVTIVAARSEAGHGHVAIVAPMDMVPGGGGEVPMLFNVGSTKGMGTIRASLAFGTYATNKPTYYIRNDDLNTLNQRANAIGETGNGSNSFTERVVRFFEGLFKDDK